MNKGVIADCLESIVNMAITVMNEGICFFLFHQPKFPEKARKTRAEIVWEHEESDK